AANGGRAGGRLLTAGRPDATDPTSRPGGQMRTHTTHTVQTTRSERLLAQAATVTPGGGNSFKRGQARARVRRAWGAHIEDLDGNTYLDYHCALGPIILGHAHPAVFAAVTEAMRDGILFGCGTTEREVRLAATIVEHVPSVEQVSFCGSGSEATLHAIRLARGATGRGNI